MPVVIFRTRRYRNNSRDAAGVFISVNRQHHVVTLWDIYFPRATYSSSTLVSTEYTLVSSPFCRIKAR